MGTGKKSQRVQCSECNGQGSFYAWVFYHLFNYLNQFNLSLPICHFSKRKTYFFLLSALQIVTFYTISRSCRFFLSFLPKFVVSSCRFFQICRFFLSFLPNLSFLPVVSSKSVVSSCRFFQNLSFLPVVSSCRFFQNLSFVPKFVVSSY